MSQRQPSRRFSWKKPWAFDSLHNMRKYITEREVYKKLKVLERHSSYKKPYFNFKSHPHGELIYSWPGFPPWDRPDGPGFPDSIGDDYKTCELACTGGILDCFEGGCDDIICICGSFPMIGVIGEDATGGSAWIEGGTAVNDPLRVCIEGESTNADYGIITVLVIDAKGQLAETEHQLVDCGVCCGPFVITGADTVNPSTLWTGTISPACPGATCNVTSNSGCAIFCTMNAGGTQVEVTPGASDCGTFTVTVTEPGVEGCSGESAVKVVRINNTGQGGAWVTKTSINDPNACGANCPVGCGVGTPAVCIDSETGFKYGRFGGTPCNTGINRTCRGCTFHNCGAGDATPKPPCTGAPSCSAFSSSGSCPVGQRDCPCTIWTYDICEWECTC